MSGEWSVLLLPAPLPHLQHGQHQLPLQHTLGLQLCQVRVQSSKCIKLINSMNNARYVVYFYIFLLRAYSSVHKLLSAIELFSSF